MKKILLLLSDGFEIYEASAYIDVLGWNLLEGDGSTQLFTCALKKEIKSTFNYRFTVDYTIDQINIDEYDALAVPGGFNEFNFYQDAYDERFSALIQEFNAKGKIISSICTGALPLAKSGILKGLNGTTYQNPIRHDKLREFGVNVVEDPIVQDQNITTSHNPATAIPVAFKLLEELTSVENTNKIRTLMGFSVEMESCLTR